MKKPTVNFRTLRKHSDIYRKAAELIQYQLEHPNFDMFIDGCCSAFDEIENAAWERASNQRYHPHRYFAMRDLAAEFEDVLSVARTNFRRMYQPKHRPVYWFGEKFDRAEQEHRITALLLMADIAESEGN